MRIDGDHDVVQRAFPANEWARRHGSPPNDWRPRSAGLPEEDAVVGDGLGDVGVRHVQQERRPPPEVQDLLTVDLGGQLALHAAVHAVMLRERRGDLGELE
jgi:hypothetical protein